MRINLDLSYPPSYPRVFKSLFFGHHLYLFGPLSDNEINRRIRTVAYKNTGIYRTRITITENFDEYIMSITRNFWKFH